MNPMSLLTLPADTLREAHQHAHEPQSSCGERGERRVIAVLSGVAIALATVAVWVLR